MNEEQRLRQLARIARREEPPHVDVARRVMARLRRREAEAAPSVRPLAWVAAGSAAVAIPLAVAAVNIWLHLANPILGLFLEQSGGLL
ncbi:MAG: hypothetical protein FJX75_27755 [Armatimonadetes bacterium]|nr:hypothetical protein [Armatimonadota bacterium]